MKSSNINADTLKCIFATILLTSLICPIFGGDIKFPTDDDDDDDNDTMNIDSQRNQVAIDIANKLVRSSKQSIPIGPTESILSQSSINPIYNQPSAPTAPIYNQPLAPAVPIFNQQSIPTVPVFSQLLTTYFQPTPSPVNYNFITEFSWNLFQGSKLPNAVGNLALSPLMVELLLMEIFSVASGRTQEEIGAVLKQASQYNLFKLIVDLQKQKYNELNMASAIFVGNNLSLNESFVTRSRSKNVAIIPIDFNNPIESTTRANNWVANVTKNNIQQLFKPEHIVGQRVLLTNALYFRGSWKYQFTGTQTELFHITPTTVKSVNYMTQLSMLRANEFTTTATLGNGAAIGGQWVELPYEGNELSMIIIIPSVQHTLDNLIYQMQANDVANIIEQLYEPYKRNVQLKMPKFNVESTFSLVNVLLKLGIVNVFTINSQLPYLTNNHEPLGINDVLQKTMLQVNEKGTVAASATSVSVVALSLTYTPENLIFNVEQPFLSMIVDKRNKIPLLTSKIFDP